MCVALGAGASLAVPSNPDAPRASEAGEADEDIASDGLALRLGSEAVAEGRAIDVLVQMQPRNAGFRFNEPVRRPEAPVRRVLRPVALGRTAAQTTPVDKSKAQPLPENKTGLFGSATATAQLPSPTRNPYPMSLGDGGAGGLRHSTRPAAGEPWPAWLLWPRDVALYLRENRDFVLGGVASVLLLLGAGSWLRARLRA